MFGRDICSAEIKAFNADSRFPVDTNRKQTHFGQRRSPRLPKHVERKAAGSLKAANQEARL